MKSEIWGPHLWYYIHCTSFSYPKNPSHIEMNKHVDFILNLQYTLPCQKCRKHYSSTLRKLGFNRKHVKNRDMFSRFCVDLHNEVNKALGKPVISYKTVYNRYIPMVN